VHIQQLHQERGRERRGGRRVARGREKKEKRMRCLCGEGDERKLHVLSLKKREGEKLASQIEKKEGGQLLNFRVAGEDRWIWPEYARVRDSHGRGVGRKLMFIRRKKSNPERARQISKMGEDTGRLRLWERKGKLPEMAPKRAGVLLTDGAGDAGKRKGTAKRGEKETLKYFCW